MRKHLTLSEYGNYENIMIGTRLLDRVRHAVRVRQYSMYTEKAYIGWIRRFIFFHGKRHPAEMDKLEVEAFLSHLAMVYSGHMVYILFRTHSQRFVRCERIGDGLTLQPYSLKV